MAAPTHLDQINAMNPSVSLSSLQRIRLGTVLRGLVTRTRARTGLTSAAAQVHDVPSAILACYVTAGTPLAVIAGAAPDAGEVRVEYTDGIPTFTFAAAVTGYTVVETCVLPLASALPGGLSFSATLEAAI